MHERLPALHGVARSASDPGWVEWFRDEVALDFPSLAEAAGRMQAAFVAADQSTAAVDAEVRLTPQAARAGRRVPIDVRLRSACSRCSGRGAVRDEPCAGCAGRGEAEVAHEVHVVLPSGVRDGGRYVYSVTLPAAPAALVALRVTVGP
jgi:hypothetical protein